MMDKKNDYQFYVCIVAGDNPKKLMEPYDKNLKMEPYVIYKYEDAGALKKLYIEDYKNELNNSTSDLEREYILESIRDLEEMSDDDFYYEISDGMIIDAKTGDAMSDKNKNGKWNTYTMGKIFSEPFLTKDGREVFQARKGDVDWEKIHLSGQKLYERTWEMVMENSEPQDENEKMIYENMHDKIRYFNKFETKENYVISNTSFWGYAFLSEETGWQDASEIEDQFVWMKNFYDVYIKYLSDDTLLTIYECKK